MKRTPIWPLGGIAMALLMMHTTQAWAGIAGYFQFVSGEVHITTPDGKTHKAAKGGAVNEGDTVISTHLGTAQIKMQDGGFIAVRPDTQLKIDNFKYSGKAGEPEKSAVSLLKGGFRAVTGMVGRVNKQDYSITTPVATIGIRGTDHESYHLPVDEPGALAGTYDKVNIGETSITTDSGTLNVLPNQMGFAGGLDQPPQLQPVNTQLFSFSPDAPQGGGGGGNDGVRDNAVVDGRDGNPNPNPNGNDNNTGGVQGALLPTAVIVATDPCVGTQPLPASCTLISGGGAAPLTAPVTVATAAYAQTDKAVAIATGGIGLRGATLLVPEVNTFIATPADVNNALPNPSAIDRYAGRSAGNSITYTLNGGTTVVGAATTVAATGIQYGSYASSSSQKVVVGTTNCCAAGVYGSPGSVYSHWIVGPAVNPVYLPEVLTGTVNYTFAGGTVPTVSYNDVAALTGSSLLVNFAQQAVTFSLSGTLGVGTPLPWSAGASGVPLDTLYWNNARAGFRTTTAVRAGWAPLTVGGAFTGGDVVGQFTGNALNGAMLSYVLSNASGQIAGVAAYTGTPQNTATPYRIVGLSTIGTVPVGMTGAGTVIPVTMGGYNNSATVLTDAGGNVTQFNSRQPLSNNASSVAIGIGTATAAGLGTDPVSGISWGRWVGGALSMTNLATATVTNLPNTPNTAHWIAGPVMTGPVDLPISGTFNYVLAGGTTPTDSQGGVGTLNSASLTANFTAQTVNVALNVTTPNAGNLVANGAAIPIEQKSFFNASTANSAQGSNPGLLTVNGTGTTSGNLGGVFVGTGGIGAVMAYGLQNNLVQVNGVVAFHR